MEKPQSRNTARDIRPFALVCVAVALWGAALLYAAGARAKCAELARKDAANRALAAELAPSLAALRTHYGFIASLPAENAAVSQFSGTSKLDIIKSAHMGLGKTSVSVKWNPISGERFEQALDKLGTAEPPFRLESAKITKAGAAGSDAVAVDAVFTAYNR